MGCNLLSDVCAIGFTGSSVCCKSCGNSCYTVCCILFVAASVAHDSCCNSSKVDLFDDDTGAQGKWDGSHHTKKKRSDAPDVKTLQLGTEVLTELIRIAPNG